MVGFYIQSETKVIEPVVDATNRADVVKELETLEQSEVKVDAPVIVTEAETATDVQIQENSEEQTVDATTVTIREVGDVKSLEVPHSSEREDLANAGATKRPTCWVLVQTKPNKGELSKEEQIRLKADYDQVVSDYRELTASMF
ncbi:hypothetical protein Droror1_Dr00023501 [Drosera rotundifolia]